MIDNKNISNESFKVLFEAVPGLYLILLPDLIIYAVSDAYTLATMTKRDEIIGKHLFDIFPDNPEDTYADGVANLRTSLSFVLKNKTAHTMAVQQYDIRRPDGTFEERHWSPLNKPILDSNNEVVFIIHRVEDVTEYVCMKREQLEKEKLTADLQTKMLTMEIEVLKRSKEIQKLNEELEKKVLERTNELISINKDISDYKFALDESSIVAVTNAKGIIQQVNENFCKVSKYSAAELIGQDHRIVNSGYHSKAFMRNLWGTIATGQVWKGELKNKAKDGTPYWVDTTIVPFVDENGKPFKYLAIRSDITQRKEADEHIIKMNEELEAKVEERTLELTQSLEREKELSELKSRFVSMASHEFRTPLSAILSSVSLIENYNKEEHEEKRKKHTKRVKSCVRNLVDILNDFLSLDKLEQGMVEIIKAAFDLCEFAEDIMEEVNGILKPGQRLNFSYNGDKEVIQDKKILRNVLLNLLSNAIKYSEEEKNIHFLIDVNNNRISIHVKDEGIGIPEEEQKNLFSKFFRAYNVANIQGTGLGLNIVKKYVELLNGDISFVSKHNYGTTFTVEFPQNKAMSN